MNKINEVNLEFTASKVHENDEINKKANVMLKNLSIYLEGVQDPLIKDNKIKSYNGEGQ